MRNFNPECADCNIKFTGKDDYMVNNFLWKLYVAKDERILHLTCFEKRLGRKLKGSDFMLAPVNLFNTEVLDRIPGIKWALGEFKKENKKKIYTEMYSEEFKKGKTNFKLKENIKNFTAQAAQGELIKDMHLKLVKDEKFIKKHNIKSVTQVHDQLIIDVEDKK